MPTIKIGLSYGISRVEYQPLWFPGDAIDPDDLLSFLPRELRGLPKWAICNILGINHLTGFGSGNSAGPRTVVFITSTSAANQTYSVPATWTASDNKIECLSHGGDGGNGGSDVTDGPCCCDTHYGGFAGGGGGGGYAKSLNVALTPSGSMTFHLSPGGYNGATTDATWANGATLAASSVGICGAITGGNGGNATGVSHGGGGGIGAGASTTSAIGSTKYAGGNGSGGDSGDGAYAGAGGGAAGPTGAGGAASGTTGGTGDGGTTAADTAGTQFDGTHGSGGGASSLAAPGANGKVYGGGAVGGSDAVAHGNGQSGLIVLTNNVSSS